MERFAKWSPSPAGATRWSAAGVAPAGLERGRHHLSPGSRPGLIHAAASRLRDTQTPSQGGGIKTVVFQRSQRNKSGIRHNLLSRESSQAHHFARRGRSWWACARYANWSHPTTTGRQHVNAELLLAKNRDEGISDRPPARGRALRGCRFCSAVSLGYQSWDVVPLWPGNSGRLRVSALRSCGARIKAGLASDRAAHR